MPGSALDADPAVAAAGALARIEAMLATSNAEVVERLDAQAKRIAGLTAEVVDLRRQVADGKARDWLTVNACARRFDVSRAEVQRAIAAGDVIARVKTAPGGWETHDVSLASARTRWGGA